MPKFASKSTRGFYTPEVHGENMPDDAVEISDEYHSELIQGQSQGKIIDWSGDFPTLVEPMPPTEDELAICVRSERDRLLVASDWTQLSDVPAATREKWIAYRQALRDISEQDGFPLNIDWPVTPQ